MENVEQNKFLGEVKVSKLLLRFSVPCVLSLLISALYGIVDQVFIGNSELGYVGNAAAGVVFPITIVSLAFAWFFGDGVAAFLSICQGKNDIGHLHKSVGTALTATLAVGLLFVFACSVFMDKILFLFGASESSIGYAREYFVIILAATPVFMLMNTMSAIIRADGSPAYSMLLTVVGAVLNLILDPIFIFAFRWGMKGAAWATIIGQIAAFILAAAYFFRSKTFRLRLSSFLPDFGLLGKTAKLGASTFITQISIVIISLVCNITLAKYGAQSKYGPDIPIAVIGIAMKVFTIVINIVVGIILGGQPILGYNYGAKKYDRVRETFKLVLIVSLAVCVVATLIFEVFPKAVVGLFGSQPDPYPEFAVMTFRIFLMFVMFTCLIKMVSIFFQSIGHPIKSAIISIARDLVFFVPLVIILPIGRGVRGALWAAPIADAIGIILTACFAILFFKKLGRETPPAITAKTENPDGQSGFTIGGKDDTI